MADYQECPNDNEKCIKEECEYYDEECELKICENCSYYNSCSGNCSLSGDWVYEKNYCTDGDFYNPYKRL